MADESKSLAAALAAALLDLNEAAARRRTMRRDSAEYAAALSDEVRLSKTVYDLTRALRQSQID